MRMIQQRSTLDQRGMVSFLVTFIMLLVISLIVVGFTRVASQNRREALDRQLSTQAFYAAESGVNAFLNASKTDPSLLTTTRGTCDTQNFTFEKTLSNNPEVSVTCVLVDPLVPHIEVTGLDDGESQIFTIDPRAADGTSAALTRLVFVWESKGDSTLKTGCPTETGKYTATISNCEYGLLRADIMKDPGSPYSADVLTNSTRSTLFLPSTTPYESVSLNYGLTSNRAHQGRAKCADGVPHSLGGIMTIPPQTCGAVVNISSAAAGARYYARVSTLYKGTKNLKIYGYDASGAAVDFAGAQVQIDSTGKAVDVLRRVQVRVPIDKTSGETVLPFAVYSEEDVCKRFTTAGDNFEDSCSIAPGEESDASYTPCGGLCGPDGEGGGTGNPYWYRAWFTVTSNNDPSRITGCAWSWGDGSSPATEVVDDISQCNLGGRMRHDFTVKGAAGSCYKTTVVFTVYLGSVAKTYPQEFWVPFSSRVKPWCPRP